MIPRIGLAGSIAYVLILTAASLVPVTVFWTTTSPNTVNTHSMAPFSSYDAIHQFILTESCNSSLVRGLYNPAPSPGVLPPTTPGSGLLSAQGSSSASTTPTYSQTNAQVSGVDELDTVKTDGIYIYTVTNNTVAIVLAYPTANAKLMARIAVNGTIQGIFIDGTKLAVVSENYRYYPYPIPYLATGTPVTSGIVSPFYFNPQTSSVWIYDLSNRSSPALTTTLIVNGTFAGARLIDNEMYLIATLPVYCNEPIPVPENIVNGQLMLIAPNQIYHSDIADYAHSFTTVVGMDISQQNPTPTVKSFLIGTSSNIYVSTNNIYLTQPIWSQTEQTAIHRININGSNIIYEATGTVTGHVLNQFSMDEYNGFFRIATTDYENLYPVAMGATTYVLQRSETSLYVLDSSMHITGLLTGLSPGETFYAARFMGDKAYLVTYQRMDPLFVIGLHDPSNPIVLGQLNITGVSDYLQPYDDNHLIGLGKSSTNVTWENAALFQGLKFSFFDVTDPNHPIDTSNYLAGGRGSNSPALTDHKAVLFDQPLNLLVVPVEIVPVQNSTDLWYYGTPVFQGAYVFNVSIQNGIVFRGGVTQLPSGQVPSWTNSNLFITRSLYIGNVLYTLSNGMVMMNSLTDLSLLGSVNLA